jgi:hypothetical protein
MPPIVVVPPGISCFREIVRKVPRESAYFLLDPSLQAAFFRNQNLETLYPEDLLDVEALASINEEARQLAMQWFRQGPLADRLLFCGVNMGGLFVSELTYFLIGALKAVKVTRAVLDKWGRARPLYLVNDESYWPKIFRAIAGEEKVEVREILVKRRVTKRASRSVKTAFKEAVKKVLSWIHFPSDRKLAPHGILYSSSPRFVEPLWKSDPSAASYYLRPEYSIKVFDRIKKRYPNLHHFTPFRGGDRGPRIASAAWQKERGFPDCVAEEFRKGVFFRYERVNLWPLIENDFRKKLNGPCLRYGEWIYSIQRILKQLQPRLVVVDEDVSPFNQALAECAKAKGIPCLQIQHGIMGPSNHLIPIRSTRMLVVGEVSKERLVGWGAEEEQIVVLGAPQYEMLLRKAASNGYRGRVHAALGLSNDVRIVTLLTHFFHTEERPDWIGAADSPAYIRKIIQISLRAVRGLDKVQLVIKLHPRETNDWFTREVLQEERAEKEVIVVKHFDTPELIQASHLVLGCLSTVYYDALVLERPILVFDDSRRRRLTFLSNDYLDESNSELAESQIRGLILDESLRSTRLARQKFEQERHFLKGNVGSIERFWKVAEELIQEKGHEPRSLPSHRLS